MEKKLSALCLLVLFSSTFTTGAPANGFGLDRSDFGSNSGQSRSRNSNWEIGSSWGDFSSASDRQTGLSAGQGKSAVASQSRNGSNQAQSQGQHGGTRSGNQGRQTGFGSGSNLGFGGFDTDSSNQNNNWNRGSKSETAAHFSLGGERRGAAIGEGRISGGRINGAEIDSFAGVDEREGNVRSGARARRISSESRFGQSQAGSSVGNIGSLSASNNADNNKSNNGWSIGDFGSRSSVFGSGNGGFGFQSSRKQIGAQRNRQK